MNLDFIYRGETLDLDDVTRGTCQSGSFINLTDGYTHFELVGEPGDHAVVLVHGFTIPYFIWDPTFSSLGSAGFRVLRYDLYGRGFSDRPHRSYDINLFVGQLHDLMDGLKFKQVDLIGLSMGGAIASAYTVHHPEKVSKLILIDPIGVVPMPLSFIYNIAMLPGISELILGLAGTERMVSGLASDFYDPSQVRLFHDQYLLQMRFKGFKRAILSTLRSKTVNGFPTIYEELGKLKLPIMLLWGRDDRTLPLQQSDPLLKLISPREFHIIDHTGHIPHYEKPETVNPLLINFLKSK